MMIKKQKNTKLWAWLNLVIFAFTIAFNYTANAGLINDMSQREVSDKFNTLITPAPFAFSIWGLIYFLVFFTIIYMIVKETDPKVQKLISLISPLFWASCLFNAAWIVAFSFEMIGLSSLLILGLTVSLILIDIKIVENTREIPFRLPSAAVALYSGWLTLATFVNFASFLVSIGWDGFGLDPTVWATVMVIAAAIVVALLNLKLKSALYPLPVAWGLFAIIKDNDYGNTMTLSTALPTILYILIAVLIIWAVVQFFYNGKCIQGKEGK